MQVSPEFSVVIPLYNKAEYIQRALSSVLAQTVSAFEVLVIDDGSTDGGGSAVSELRDPRIHLITQENRGVAEARNRGINEASCDFIAFLDADDEWSPAFLAEMKALIIKYPGAGIYASNHVFEYADGTERLDRFDHIFDDDRRDGYLDDFFRIFADHNRSPFSNSGICMPRQVLLSLDGYKAGVRLTEDSDLWCRIALRLPVAYTRLPLSRYHLETPSSSGYLFEPKDNEVSKMLQAALDQGQVAPRFRPSVRKLIAMQQLDHVKRAVLLSHRLYALRKVLDRRIVRQIPAQFLVVLLSILMPTALVQRLSQRMRRRRNAASSHSVLDSRRTAKHSR